MPDTDFQRRLQARARNLRRNLDRIVREAAVDALETCQDLTPVRTGQMKENWRETSPPARLGGVTSIENDENYAAYIERGASPKAPEGILVPASDEVAGRMIRKLCSGRLTERR